MPLLFGDHLWLRGLDLGIELFHLQVQFDYFPLKIRRFLIKLIFRGSQILEIFFLNFQLSDGRVFDLI